MDTRRSLIGAVTLQFALLSALGVAIAGVSASRRLFDIPPVAVLREMSRDTLILIAVRAA